MVVSECSREIHPKKGMSLAVESDKDFNLVWDSAQDGQKRPENLPGGTSSTIVTVLPITDIRVGLRFTGN